MENVGQYSSTLVYPSPTARTHDAPDNHSVNASSSWLPGHKSASANSPSTNPQSSPVYPVVDRSADHENYASSPASAPYGSMPSADQYSAYPQSPSVRTNDEAHSVTGMALPSQVPASIGPDRVARRQTRAHSSLQIGLRRDRAPQPDIQTARQDSDEQASYFMSPASAISRPQTPASCPDSARYQQQADRGSMFSITSSCGGGNMSLQSPRYLPTPVSGSPYSPFALFPAHSRTSSSYSTSIPRSASPALSVASALTSISSNSVPNSQSFSAYPLPSPPVGPIVPRAKQRKQRLFNVDRKAICVYHQENPNARQEDIAARYGVERSTISKILKHKTKWMNVPEDDDMRVAKHRPSKFPEVEEELVNWLVQMKQQNTLLTDALIRNKAKETARNLQIPEERFKASSGWVENFKHRHNIRKGVWLGHNKVLRGTRGIGATHLRKSSNESALSPLNPAFEPRSEVLAQRDSTNTAEEGDDDMESEDDPDLSTSHDSRGVPRPPHPQQAEPSTSHHPLPPIWTMHPEPLSSTDTPISACPPGSQQNAVPQHAFPPHEDQHTEAAVTNVHQNPLPLPAQQHIPVSQPPQDVQLSNHGDNSTSYPNPVVVYQAPPITSSGNTIPDIAEAEDAINKVILFVDSQSPSILRQEERDSLTQIKYALFQAASGVPFVRERR